MPLVAHVRRVVLVLGPELHAHQIDDTGEAAALTRGDGANGRHNAEFRLHLLDAAVEVGAHAIELVDEGDARHVVLVGLVPDGLALHLNAAHGAEDADSAVEHAQAALDLGREVDVARRVDKRDARVAPLQGDGRAVDGDALGLFERVEVGGGVAFIDIAGLVLGAAEVQDALRGGGLAGVHVRDDANVTNSVEHDSCPSRAQAARPAPPQNQQRRLAGNPRSSFVSAALHGVDSSRRFPQ